MSFKYYITKQELHFYIGIFIEWFIFQLWKAMLTIGTAMCKKQWNSSYIEIRRGRIVARSGLFFLVLSCLALSILVFSCLVIFDTRWRSRWRTFKHFDDVCFISFASLTPPTACNCDPRGSRSQQCDRETGQCVCEVGVAGYRCDRCDRGTTGQLPNCQPCGECFDNWDKIIQVRRKGMLLLLLLL